MDLHAAAVEHTHGRLIGGDTGKALVVGAEAWLVEQEAKNPGALAASLVPGFSTI